MIFQEPIIEYIELNTSDIVTESGPAVEYCNKHGDTSMTSAQLCYSFSENVESDWNFICSMAPLDKSMQGHVDLLLEGDNYEETINGL